MSIETFEASRREAAELMDMSAHDLHIIEKATEPEVFYLGDIHYNGNIHHALTAQSGNFDPQHPYLYGGGTRWTTEYMSLTRAMALVGELSAEMRGKNGDPEGGRKGLIVGDGGPHLYTPRQQEDIMAIYMDLMYDYRDDRVPDGFAGPYGHIVAADMNTGGLSDAFAKRYFERSGDPFWQAAAACKSVENGGLPERPELTGLGAIKWLKELMRANGEDEAWITYMGFGQVAAWAAYNAVREQEVTLRSKGFSDKVGMLTTEDPAGMTITLDMVKNIGDARAFKGNKMLALQKELRADGLKTDYHEDNTRIAHVPTDYFMPAAGPDVIDLKLAKVLAARKGVIEAANGPTKPDAHQYLVHVAKKKVGPDVDVNKQGRHGSRIERRINLGELNRDKVNVRDIIIKDSEESARETIRKAKELKTPDLRVGTAAKNLGYLASYVGVAA